MPSFSTLLLLAAACAVGPNMLVWTFMGLLRLLGEKMPAWRTPVQQRYDVSNVAVVIAAHNEAQVLPFCLRAVARIIPLGQVYIGNDASRDATANIAQSLGCNVFTAPTNLGKARVLDATIKHFDLCNRNRLVLILDADSEIDPHYLRNGLKLFDDPGIAVVAGHVDSRPPARFFSVAMFLHTYRVRLYYMIQSLFRYGQSWKPLNVTFVAPGFASLYRADVLAKLDIAAPGLVIEDINMTFDVHAKKLGRITYSPLVRASTEDPATIADYSRQVKRWNLGLWQTVGRQRKRFNLFWIALLSLQVESIASALVVLLLPFVTVWSIVTGNSIYLWSPFEADWVPVAAWLLPTMFIGAELILSFIIAFLTQRFDILLFAPFYPVLRYLDALWTVATIPMAIFSKSDGKWKSPQRRIVTPAA